ncbi:Putative chromatin SPT2 [Septoria linicola]|uniref:Chromatin SPT2 n=1 Tax=Septoria linicola TaxID=215465 RepID=A0A9Q9AHZ5_9PEZI|nr:Putative chromatin SPT2 [Septoria linicola]
MTSFTSLLGSIGGPKQNQAPVQKTTGQPRAPQGDGPPTTTSSSVSRPTTNNVAAGVKRKPDEQITAPPAKIVRTEVKVPVRPSISSVSAKPAIASPGTNAPYRGTSRPVSAGISTKPSLSSAKPASNAAAAAPIPAVASGSAPKPKRGFASLMEKAKAAQEAVKAAGASTIKHKPVEKLTKKERMKLGEEAKQKSGLKNGKTAVGNRSRSGTPADGKAALQKKPSEPGYKGTMKKTPVQPQIAYKGTMKKSEPGAPPARPPAKKGMGQDKYGGYASWSDLDDAEEDDEEGEGYGSDESDDMDAGFDDMAREEEMALRAARKEDQEALEEEERHRREKLERKKKLEALSKSAAARKRF